MYDVTFLPILAAGIVSVLIGYVWYHPRVFGSVWMRHANLSPEARERGGRRAALGAFIGLLASMLAAWVMNVIGVAFGIFDIAGAVLDLALWIWLGFVVPVMLGAVLWEQRSWTYFAINAFYWLVSLSAMAIVLVL